ncbi:MAG: hypothetical protein GC182_18820 [Rhodopseudomonas sp.]|nr:hypothetical protein [Rhodopseudomonas sp.]
MPMLDPISVASIPLFPRFNDVDLSSATGFFYKSGDNVFLVSNWHVMSGRNPNDGQSLDTKNGSIPNRVALFAHKTTIGHFRRDLWLSLIDDNGRSLWRQHRDHGQNVDIAVLRVPEIGQGSEIKFYCVNEQDSEAPLSTRVGADVFIVGFPKGLALQEILPIWKRGTIATEFSFPVGGLPIFLVDSATREGMSGAPVYARSVGIALMDNGGVEVSPSVKTRFLGVYSGRYGADDEFSAQVGRVWHKELIEEIIVDGVEGRFDLR